MILPWLERSALLALLAWLPACSAPDGGAPATARGDDTLLHAPRVPTHGQNLDLPPEVPLDPAHVASPSPGWNQSAAFGSGQWFFVWSDLRLDTGTYTDLVFGKRIAPDGTSLDDFGIPLLGIDASTLHYLPTVGSDGTDYLVVVPVGGHLRGIRVSAGGVVLDPGGFDIVDHDVPEQDLTILFDGTNYLVLWVRANVPSGSGSTLYLTRVTPTGVVLDPGGIPLITNPAGLAASFDGTNLLLTWVDLAPDLSTHQVRGARVTPSGAVLDPSGFTLSPVIPGYGYTYLHTSFDGQNHMVTWLGAGGSQGGSAIWATRVSPQGAVLDPSGIMVHAFDADTSIDDIDAAFDGAGTLVTWSRDDYYKYRELQYTRLMPDGTISPTAQTLPDRGHAARLFSNGAGALLSWVSAASMEIADDTTPIVGKRLGADSSVLDAQPLALTVHPNYQEVRAAASDGQTALVVWTEARPPSTGGHGLYGVRVGPAGQILDAASFPITDQAIDDATVVFDGENFVVVFADKSLDDPKPYRAVRVSPQGVVLDPVPAQLPLCGQGTHNLSVAAAGGGSHTLILANGCDLANLVLGGVILDHDLQVTTPVLGLAAYDDSDVLEAQAVYDGTNFFALQRQSGGIVGRRISIQGELLDDQELVLASGGPVHAVRVDRGDGNLLVVWHQGDELRGGRIDPAGQVLDGPQGFLVATPGSAAAIDDCFLKEYGAGCPAVAFDGKNHLVAWRARTDANDPASADLYAVPVSPSGAVGTSFALSQAPGGEGVPVLAPVGGKVLASYSHLEAPEPYSARRAYATLVDTPGGGGGVRFRSVGATVANSLETRCFPADRPPPPPSRGAFSAALSPVPRASSGIA